MFTYTHIALYKDILQCLLSASHVCICSGLTAWDWMTYQEAHPCRRPTTLPQQPLITALHLGSGPYEIAPIHVGMPMGAVAVLFR